MLAAAGAVIVALALAAVATLRSDGAPVDDDVTGVAASGAAPTSAATPGGVAGMGKAPASPSATGSPRRSAAVAPPSRPSGWPDAGNTGVPAGVRLSAYTGSRTLTKSGTVLDGKSIKGCLTINAKNVTIRRSKIECDDWIVRVADGASVTIEDSELDGKGTASAIGYDNFTLRRVDIHNMNEGPRVGDHVLIEDSWIHDLSFTSEDDHQDILQTTGGVGSRVRHNTLDASARDGHQFNAAFMVGAELAPELAGLVVEENLIGGGGYSVNFRGDPNTRDVVFRNNTFKRDAEWGAVSGEDSPGVTWAASNVWLDDHRPVA